MKKYKTEELQVGKVYEDCEGLYKYIGKKIYDSYEFIELLPVEDENGELIDGKFEESDFIRLLNSSELFFE